ncbi:MAG: IPT/TIG domain-containing protein [Candidatus Paceibacterota bacterium]|jgi:hypothetical protein
MNIKIFNSIKIFFLVLVVLFGVGHSVALAAQPVVSSISPNPAHVGETVTITGTDFVSGSRIVLYDGGGTPFTMQAVSLTATQITFQVPLGAINGAGSLYVARPPLAGEGDIPNNQGLLSNRFDINLLDTAPTITNITPTTVHVGDVVNLTGTGFDTHTNVQFTDNYVGGLTGYWANLKTFTPTTLSFVVPFGVKGLRTLQVKHIYSGLTSNTTQLTILPIAPILNSISPTPVRAGITESFFHGDNIDSDSRVIIDNVTELSLGQCRISKGPGTCFYIPSGVAAGTHSMYIKQKDSGLTSGTISFTITDDPVAISLYGNIYAGGKVVVTGVGFDQYSAVLIDGPTGTAIPRLTAGYGLSDSAFAFMLPGDISKGAHTIQVKQTDTGKVSNTLSFTVIEGSSTPTPPPVITPTPTPNPTPNPVVTPPPTPPTTPPVLGCSGGNIFNTQTGLPCVNNVGNDNQSPANFPSQSSGSSTYDFGDKTLRNGSRGEAVRELQRYLNDKLNLGLVLDGKLGPKTIAVIKMWQADHGLVADGLIGKMTKAQMLAEVN